MTRPGDFLFWCCHGVVVLPLLMQRLLGSLVLAEDGDVITLAECTEDTFCVAHDWIREAKF